MSPLAAKSPYAGYRFPAEVISQAVWLSKPLMKANTAIGTLPGN